MKSPIRHLCATVTAFVLASLACVAGGPAQTPATPPGDPARFELFLLVGQSNMAGRAPVSAEDKVADPNVLVLSKDDQWVTQGEPIHFDKPGAAGVGPGYTFAKLYAQKHPGIIVGVIPCAFGGTSVEQWDPASGDKKLYPPDNLYNNAIRRAKIAMQTGTLKGILWHQGESNSDKGDPSTYADHVAKLVAKFREDLNAPKVPFIAGEIGYFTYSAHPLAQAINQQIGTLPQVVPDCAIASAQDLNTKGDNLHFDNASAKELGKRYLESYEKVAGATPAGP